MNEFEDSKWASRIVSQKTFRQLPVSSGAWLMPAWHDGMSRDDHMREAFRKILEGLDRLRKELEGK